MERLTIDEAIKQAREVAEKKYTEGMLCHANPNDDLLDGCIKCAEEHEQIAEWLEKLKEYEQAEEDGLLIRLPCKVGDIVWYVDDDDDNYPQEFEIIQVKIHNDCVRYFANEEENDGTMVITEDDFGKTVFTTKTEVEQALAKMKGE